MQSNIYSVDFLNFNHIDLTLGIQCDVLSILMMSFIAIIGIFIFRYAQNYLESDHTKVRFLMQFCGVLASVMLLALCANLLTAFVAWQFIGLNLYLLLNHYHTDPNANKAAKKKFVINQVGDCSFLAAIILAYHTHSAASFSRIAHSSDATLICLLIMISIMTKCAQFPFHIWLIDTMETPTPVSALMHAGVINAGGFLVTRMSLSMMNSSLLCYMILTVGLISALASIPWMNNQPDTKKKLAYSTMGQMGYMLIQCALGSFPAAIFHLMSHGFYKASLFLNAGESYSNALPVLKHSRSPAQMGKAYLISSIIFFPGIALFSWLNHHIPPLMLVFMFLTVTTLILKANKLIEYASVVMIYVVYLCCFYAFSVLLSHYLFVSIIPESVQWILGFLIFMLQNIIWITGRHLRAKDKTEQLLRQFILNPIRKMGSAMNNMSSCSFKNIIYVLMLIFAGGFFLFHLHSYLTYKVHITSLQNGGILIFLCMGIVSLIIANRCLTVKGLVIYLLLFELCFTNIAFLADSRAIFSIGIFHIVNIASVLLMLACLGNRSHKDVRSGVLYLTIGLLLLIGIPGSASFVSDFYVFRALITIHTVYALLYAVLMILNAIVIMHSLQLYVFKKNTYTQVNKKISRVEHIIFSAIIAMNLISGLMPQHILTHL